GFPADLLARARMPAPESARARERLTQELGDALRAARTRAAELDDARRAAEAEAARLHEVTEATKKEGAERRRQLTAESQALLARAREAWQLAQREARRAEKTTRADVDALKREIESVEHGLGDLADRAGDQPQAPAGLPADALTPGRRVRVTEHGIGRGVLRDAVQKHLRAHPQVTSQRMAQQNEGGRGVTVANLT